MHTKVEANQSTKIIILKTIYSYEKVVICLLLGGLLGSGLLGGLLDGLLGSLDNLFGDRLLQIREKREH